MSMVIALTELRLIVIAGIAQVRTAARITNENGAVVLLKERISSFSVCLQKEMAFRLSPEE